MALPQEQLDDADIADAIENEYRFDHSVNVNNIDVEVINGIAELTGTVNNLKSKERASRIAELVKGARVFLENKENMPFQETEINALFRY